MSFEIENPWNVENLEEFLYFCCPECDLKDQSKIEFLQHALEQHPKAKECVQQFNEFIVKQEFCDADEDDLNCFSENFNDSIYDYGEILKCEVKEEPSDPNDISSQASHHNSINILKNNNKSEFSLNSSDPIQIDKNNHNCEMCGKSFTVKNSLLNHISAVHKGLKEHKCHLCNKAYGYKNILKAHIKNVHEQSDQPKKRYKCEKCDITLATLNSLKRHDRFVHKKGSV